jgi:hypothetical protein
MRLGFAPSGIQLAEPARLMTSFLDAPEMGLLRLADLA